MVEFDEAGKIFFAAAILCLLITTLVAFGALFMVSFSGNLDTASAPTTVTNQEFAGTNLTAYALNGAPIISLSKFQKAAQNTTGTNATKITVNSSVTTKNMTIQLNANAANGGQPWSNLTIEFGLEGLNQSNNITWLAGNCNAANKTWVANTKQTYNDINSTCLTPGGQLTFVFANTSLGAPSTNVTSINITYSIYATNTAYTLQNSAGTITPTATGYYRTSYVYGAGGKDYTDAQTALASGVTTITGIPSWLTIIVLVFVLLVIFAVLGAIVLVARGMMGGGQQ